MDTTLCKENENIAIKTHIDLESSCRICLLSDSELILIFDQLHSFNGVSIATMINECSPYKAIRFDDYPQQICLKCVEDVKVAYSFRKHCEDSYSIITAYLNGGQEPSITDLKVIPKLDKCTQTDENSVHPCEKCDLKFFTIDSLRLHRLYKHRGSKNECRICKKTFRRVGDLTGHYTMYHPELGFHENINCNICGKSFERKTYLTKHLTQVHKISKVPKPINENTQPLNQINSNASENHLEIKELEINVDGLTKKGQRKGKKNIESKKARSRKKAGKNIGKQILDELSEDEIPISKLKEDKLILEHKIESESAIENFSDAEFDFSNDITNTQDDSEEDKIEIGNIEISENQTIDKEITEPGNAEIKVKTEENSETLSENALNINQIKNLNLKIRTCTICLKVFRFPHHLKRHMLAKHSNEKQFKCTTCASAFATPDYLKSHMKKCPIDRSISRARVKKYDCKGCEEKFSSTRALNNHMRAEHPNLFKKVFTCSYCSSSFQTRHECTVHTNTLHENDKEYLCTQCGQRFVRNRALEIHMRRHRGEKNHKCKFCGKGFVRAGDKDLHEKYHTGDKRFKCEICGQGFVRNYSLRVHMRIHTGEKPYRCENCPRTFAQSNDLKTHVRRDHTGERYVCEIDNCGESFLQLYLLNRHKRNVHNISAASHIQRVKKVYEIDANSKDIFIVGS
ncbi:zinc finger protein 85-like [Condylostylus longicornis]|uniref:zinc finger protein 85-like n=1 Tax=Condylostylus longicornis TaxID=2530218 RepID=UPI00244DCA97|nr:zinc finger protein 85-like [Condylostylus longicornis]